MNAIRLFACLSAAVAALAPIRSYGWGASHSSSGSWAGGSWDRSGSSNWSNGNWSHSGSASYTNRWGQTYSANGSSSGHYGDGWHNGSGSVNTSWGSSANWNRSAGYGGGYHYGGRAYGGCYGAGLRVGYVPPVGRAVVAGPAGGVAVTRVGPFARVGYCRRW